MKTKKLAAVLFLFILGAVMACISWQRWPDLMIDFGKELYIPWQLNNGAVYFRDIIHFYGPLPHFVNATVFKLFGTQIMSLALFNIVLIVILSIFIYSIIRNTTDDITAVAACATFFSLFAFSQYVVVGNYNFVCPYSHGLVHGVILSFAAIYAFMMYVRRGRSLWLLVIGLAVGTVALTKVEPFFAIVIAMTAGILFAIVKRRSNRSKTIKTILLLFCGFWLPILAFATWTLRSLSLDKAISAIITPYQLMFEPSYSESIFYRGLLGFHNFPHHVVALLKMVGFYVLAFFIIGSLSRALSRIRNKMWRTGILVFIILVVVGSGLFVPTKMLMSDMFRPLPLVAILFITWIGIKLRRASSDPDTLSRLLPLLVFAIFAFVLLAKMILNVHIWHYGFALAMPATLLLVAVFLYYIPAFLAKGLIDPRVPRCICLAFVGMVLLMHVNTTMRIYNVKTYAVGSGGDLILTFRSEFWKRGQIIHDALDKIEQIVDENENFVVLPQGVMLNYLTRRKNPCPYFDFTPSVVEMVGEEHIVNVLKESSPNYIIFADRYTEELGYYHFGFGREYGKKILSWIRKKYRPVCQIGSPVFNRKGPPVLTGKDYGIIIFKRAVP